MPPRRLLTTLRHAARHELTLLILLASLAALLWTFAEIAEDVHDGDSNRFDRNVLLSLRNPQDLSDPVGPEWIEEMARDFTGLGGVGVLTFLTLAVAGLLAFAGRLRTVALIAASIGGGLLLSTLLKLAFDRPRPDLVPHGSLVYTASFPSGHSMMAAATYLTLGALLMRTQQSRVIKAYLLTVAVTLTIAVGVSRVYLGVHWPTDVLAGWTIGAAWAITCWLTAGWLQRKGEVEPPAPDILP